MYKTLGRLFVKVAFFLACIGGGTCSLFQLLIHTCHYVLAILPLAKYYLVNQNILRLSSLCSTFLALKKKNSEQFYFEMSFFEGLNGTPFSYRLSYLIERPICDLYPLGNIN